MKSNIRNNEAEDQNLIYNQMKELNHVCVLTKQTIKI